MFFIYKFIEHKHEVELIYYAQPGKKVKRSYQSESTLRDSLSVSMFRSKRAIEDIARNNDFDYFLTLTFDPKKFDNTKLDNVSLVWGNLRRLLHIKGYKVLAVPEYHKDKRKIHLHILIQASNDFEDFWTMTRDKLKGKDFKLWGYGFSLLERIGKTPQDTIKLAHYIRKYINKDLIAAFGRKRYWSSKGLNRGRVMFLSQFSSVIIPEDLVWDYESKKYPYKVKTLLKKPGFNAYELVKQLNIESRKNALKRSGLKKESSNNLGQPNL